MKILSLPLAIKTNQNQLAKAISLLFPFRSQTIFRLICYFTPGVLQSACLYTAAGSITLNKRDNEKFAIYQCPVDCVPEFSMEQYKLKRNGRAG